jgi:hypothetical protein
MDRGKPVIVLRASDATKMAKRVNVNYLARLRQRMPTRLSRQDVDALDEMNRGER